MLDVNHEKPYVPADIAVAIFNELTLKAEDRATLASCRLVSREWDALACPFVFKTLSVTFESHGRIRMADLLDFLCEYPTIAGHIRSLSVENRCWTLLSGARCCTAPVTMEDLCQLMDKIPNLRDLRLRQVCPSEGLPANSPRLAHKYSLRRLAFTISSRFTRFISPPLLDVLSIFASIIELVIDWQSSLDELQTPWRTSSHFSSIRPRLAETMMCGFIPDDRLLVNPAMCIWYQSMRTLIVGYLDLTFHGTLRMNRFLSHLTSLEELEIRYFCSDSLTYDAPEVAPLDLASCIHLTRVHVRLFLTVPLVRPIWTDFTAYILRPLAKRRSGPVQVRVCLDATNLLSVCSEDEAQSEIVEHTEGVADALARASEAGGLSGFTLWILPEKPTSSYGGAVDAMRRAFADKVSPLAGSCRFEVC